MPKPHQCHGSVPPARSTDEAHCPSVAADGARALCYAELGAIGIFGAAAYLAGDLGILIAIALTAVIGFGLQLEAERRLTARL